MLDSSGKLLERLLLQRLESHLDAHGGRRRAANQYGFRKGVSTVSAVEKVLSVAADAASRPGTKDLWEYRYLGVILDRRLTFAAHINTVATKASRSAAALARIMPNINGPSQSKRRLLATVVESQLLYAAPVWCDTVAATVRTRGMLVRPQRAAALRVTREYRTVSDEAALVLAEMPPADLLSLERKRILSRVAAPLIPGTTPPSRSLIRRQERNETIAQWQARWLSTTRAAWTRLLLPDVGRWLGRTVPKKPLSYHMTQALTGHGCFQQYLYKFGRAKSPRCTLCHDQSDTADHTLFFCPFFDGTREEFRSRLGRTPR